MLSILHFWEILGCVPSSPASFRWPIKTEDVSVCIYNHVDWPANCKTSGRSYEMHVLRGSMPDVGPFIQSLWSGWSHFLLWETTCWPKPLISTFCRFSHFFFMLLNFKSSSIISLIYVSIYQKSIIVNHEHTFLLADVWRLGVDTARGSMKLMVGDENQARWMRWQRK